MKQVHCALQPMQVMLQHVIALTQKCVVILPMVWVEALQAAAGAPPVILSMKQVVHT